jgi:DNA-binding transcriptional LysR family regulator
MSERLDDLRLFLCVAESRSFTKAAQRLNLSKSAASRRLSMMEERLGVRLLQRTTRHISLTEAGAAFRERLAQILESLDEAQEALAAQALTPRGALRLSAPMSFGIRHLGPAIARFMAAYPDITVDIDLSDRHVDLVEEGYDAAIRIGRLGDSTLIARRLCPVRTLLCASPAYLARHGTPALPRDLESHQALFYAHPSVPDAWTFKATPGSDAVIEARPIARMRANNGDALRTAAVAGLGLTLLPSFIVDDDLRRGTLIPVLHDYVLSPLAIHVLHAGRRLVSPKVRVFIDFMVGQFSAPPYWEEGL